jgi:hypothetical protein
VTKFSRPNLTSNTSSQSPNIRVQAAGPPKDLTSRLEVRIREAIKLRTQVEAVPSGTLSSDGKKISDEGTWD